MRIDLHTHSTASDGTVSPARLVALAAQVGLDVVAVTDHDSGAGWAEATAAALGAGVMVVPGMEISTRLRGAAVHLLAYLPDPTYPPLRSELEHILTAREGRLEAILCQLRAAGVDITTAEVRAQVGSAPAIGRPHIADVLIAKGVVADRAEAFDRWLSGGRPGHTVRYATPTDEMVRLVTQSGGATVIAHPWGRGSRRVMTAETLAELMAVGLTGIEVDHQDHGETDRAQLREIARDLDLVVTGSSDFHGIGKVDHELGCNVTDADEFSRLLAAAGRHAEASGRTVPRIAGPEAVEAP